jgi:hypothetical protein
MLYWASPSFLPESVRQAIYKPCPRRWLRRPPAAFTGLRQAKVGSPTQAVRQNLKTVKAEPGPRGKPLLKITRAAAGMFCRPPSGLRSPVGHSFPLLRSTE